MRSSVMRSCVNWSIKHGGMTTPQAVRGVGSSWPTVCQSSHHRRHCTSFCSSTSRTTHTTATNSSVNASYSSLTTNGRALVRHLCWNGEPIGNESTWDCSSTLLMVSHSWQALTPGHDASHSAPQSSLSAV
uniref:Uncharacterized protein n=1 Tax=Cacopsylla melanoneura TaxID=428564 RepID=A0A8D8VD89_9HEMI